MSVNERSKKNLKPFTSESGREAGKKGAKASAKARRKKKKMKQAMDLLLSLPVSGTNKEKLEFLGIDAEDADNQMLMLTVAMQQALKGNIKAMHFIKEITGATATTELERQKLRLERERLKILREQLELDKKSKNADDDDGVEIINDV